MANISIIGLWHLGCVTAACLAGKHQVVGYDPNPKVVNGLKTGKPPLFEPGLAEAITGAASRGLLKFSSNLEDTIAHSDIVYVAFDTPVDENDCVDLSLVEKTLENATPYMRDGQMVIVSSQVPIGTCRRLHAKISNAGKNVDFCYIPENLRLGEAIEAFTNPQRIVFGVSSTGLEPVLEKVFSGIPGERMYMGLESAEMVKHATNSYLALMISFSGEISDLCEKTGANAIQVMAALRKERKVSPYAPLAPGLGFGGGTLARDLQILRAIGKERGVSTLLLDSAYNANRARMGYVQKKLSMALGSLSGENMVAFFGLTYKPGTDTLRRSLALEVIGSLKPSGAQIRAFDPVIKSQVESHPYVAVCASPEEAADGADAIVITTAWEQFKSLDYSALGRRMRQPVIIDARNLLSPEKLGKEMRYFGVGVTYG